jgi:hypothetical protein
VRALRPAHVARCAEIEHLGDVTEELVASIPVDPALEALAEGLKPARALGLDVDDAERILRDARSSALVSGNGVASTNGTGHGHWGGGESRLAGSAAASHASPHAAAARAALTNLAKAAGLKIQGVRDLIPDPARRRGIDGAIAEIALILDMDTFEEQALAGVRAKARAQGLGPVKWWDAVQDRRRPRLPDPADPAGHLLAWRTRGVLTRAGDVVRRAIGEALPTVPERLRPRYEAAGQGDLEERIEAGLDRLISEKAPEAATTPDYRLWRFAGWLQWLNLGLFVLAIVSLVGGLTGAIPVWTIHLPFFRAVPAAPFVLVLCPLVAFALTTGLNIHAEKLGRAWSSRIENDIRRGIREVIEAEAFAPIAPVESARARLGEAWHRILAG